MAKTAGEKGTACTSAVARVPFVLLHGFGQRGASWDDIAARLRAAGHAVYAPDLVRRGERGSQNGKKRQQGRTMAFQKVHKPELLSQ